jgi:hypothetical protein
MLAPSHRGQLDKLLSAAESRPTIADDEDFADAFSTVRGALALPDVVEGFEELLAAVRREAAPAREVVYAGTQDNATISLSSTWTTEDLRLRLGADAEEFFAGLRLRGSLPGQARALFPLRLGGPERLGPLVARVYGWDGELIGEGPVAYRQSIGMPRGSFDFEVSRPADVDLAAAVGVFVALDGVDRQPMLPHELRRLARKRSVRSVREAIELARSGDVAAAAEAWNQAHRMREVPTLVETRPTLPRIQALPGDCLRALVLAWRRDAAQVLDAAATMGPQERLTVLAPLLRDLGRAVVSCEEVASAYEVYADALAELGDVDAAGYLIDALERRYRLHDSAGAAEVVRKLNKLNESGNQNA